MAEDAPESIDGIMGPSIPERSHGAGEASPDAARVDNPDGPQSSHDIGEARDVLADDPRPLTRSAAGTAAAQSSTGRGRTSMNNLAPSGAVPLLGLESITTEKTGFISVHIEDSNQSHCYAPLLGTTASQSIEISRGSSKKRSPESICYAKLLREDGPSSGQKSRKTVPAEDGDCYLAFTPDGEDRPVRTTASARPR